MNIFVVVGSADTLGVCVRQRHGAKVVIRLAMVQPCTAGDPPDVGPFRVLARLGRGGFGTVYAARSRRQPDELAAVKVVHPHLSDSREFRSRFAGEIAAIQRVESDFVPRLIDHGCAGEPAWLATELIPGPSLQTVVRECRRPLPEAAVWHLGAGIAEALAAIHAVGLVHRDLKPHNVLMASVGPWIIDFSLVRLTEMPHQSSSRFPMATYNYAAPEQLLDGLQAAGGPADIFALGATMLFAATGHPPHDYDGQSPFAQEMNSRPNLAGLRGALYGLVEHCLLRSPAARPPLAELRAEFTRRVGGADDQGAFASALPPDVIALLGAYRTELAEAVHARGPARLGWSEPPDLDASTWRGQEVRPLPPVDLPGERRAAPRIAANPGTAIITQTRLDTAVLPPSAAPRHAPPPDAGISAGAVGIGIAPTVPDRAASSPVQWTHRFDSWIQAPVAVQGDTLVIACLDGAVVSLRTSHPEGLRSVSIGAAIHAQALLMARGRGPGHTAYVGAADGGVHVIDTFSGRHRALFHAEAAIEGAPVTAQNRVYVLSGDGCLHSVDPYSYGSGVHFRMRGAATGAPAATADTIFAAGADGRVHAVDAATGEERWQLPTDGLVLGAPVPVGGRLYIVGTDGILREAGIEDAREHAAVKVGAPVHIAPVHDRGRLYVGGSDGVVTAYDVTHQQRRGPAWLWERQLGDEIAGLAVAGGRVYAAAGYRLMELDIITGQARQVFQLDCLIGAKPAISERRVYVVGLGGVVSCLELRLPGSGSVLPEPRMFRSRPVFVTI